MAAQFLTFALVGAIGTMVHYGVLFAGVDLLGWAPVLATTAGAICGAIVNYILNYHVTFKSKRAHAAASPRFFAIAGVGVLINGAIVGLAVRAGLHYLLAQIIATGVVLVFGYLANRAWTFRKEPS